VAAFVKNESGIEMKLDSTGIIGEFTVWIDGELVEKKDQLKFPDKNKILKAIKQKLK
jgi:leucyl aminopeptidase (aminopeptidase T)